MDNHGSEGTLAGQTIGPYRLLREIGRGGVGTVYKARDERLDRLVALKLLTRSGADDREKARFMQEARAASALDHANICTVYDVGETPPAPGEEQGRLFIAMAHYDGVTLREKLLGGALSKEESLDIPLQVTAGLERAHEAGIVHRDLKPANLMVTDRGEVKILDFGLAKLESGSGLTEAGVRLGSASYMSPEQARGDAVDARTDIWSLGVVLYEMLAGERPFGGDYEQSVLYAILNQDPPPLEELCPGLPEPLVRAVDRMLQKDPGARFSEMQACAAELRAALVDAVSPENPPPFEAPVDTPREAAEWSLGPYRILRQIGHGGMGDVYLGVRQAPFKRYVAIKVIRRGMDTREVLQRFEMERQILAALEHPNIARILDGGITEDGLPYFAMDYVDGLPVTEYCDKHRLPVGERLRLSKTICRAVQHAHQNLVIHRDLKPSNILVTSDGTVKLLDFGVAKFLNPSLSPIAQPVTRTEVRMMTPEYASPEQVRGESLSTTSDVYSLGVLLYELLTGHRPYRLASRTTPEIVQVVCEQDPDRPSTKVGQTEVITRSDGTTQEITPAAVSKARGASVERLVRRLRGDLDRIVLMALSKEADRRYGSADQLESDIERYLTGLPVHARPTGLGYRTRKFVRRHRVGVAAGVVVALLLIGFTAFTVRQAALLRVQSEQARIEAENATAVSGFLVDLFSTTNPWVVGEMDTLRVGDFVSMNAGRLQEAFDDQPAVKARMLGAMGEVNRNMTDYEVARDLHEEALSIQRALYGSSHADVARTLDRLGRVLEDQGQYEEAEDRYREALTIGRATVGEGDLLSADLVHGIARALQGQNRFEEAEAMFLEALDMHRTHRGDAHHATAEMHRRTGIFYRIRGDTAQSRHHLDRALALFQALRLGESVDVAHTYAHIALLDRVGGHNERAEANFRRALGIYESSVGRDHPHYAATLNDLALALMSQGKYEEADVVLRETVALNRRVLGDRHNNTIANHFNWALVNNRLDRYERGDSLGRIAVEGFRRLRPPGHWIVGASLYAVGQALTGLERYAEAETVLLESYRILHEAFTDRHHQTRIALRDLVELYEAWGRAEDAARYQALLDAAQAPAPVAGGEEAD